MHCIPSVSIGSCITRYVCGDLPKESVYENVHDILAASENYYSQTLTSLKTAEALITDVQAANPSYLKHEGRQTTLTAREGLAIRRWAKKNDITMYKFKDGTSGLFFALQVPEKDTLVWVSSRPINAYHFKDIVAVSAKKESNKRILVVVGTHGDPSGGTFFNRGILLHPEAYDRARSVFSAAEYPKVDILNITEVGSEADLKKKITAGDYHTVVLGWCWSDASHLLNSVFRVPVAAPTMGFSDHCRRFYSDCFGNKVWPQN